MGNAATRPSTGTPRRVPARLRGDDGTAIVETALIGPVFLLLLFGTLEYGRAFFSYQAAVSAVQGASRGVQIANSNALADFTVLTSLINGGRGFDFKSVRYLVVWHATKDTSDITVDAPGCAAGTASGHTLTVAEKPPTVTLPASTINYCNVYDQAQIQAIVTNQALQQQNFGCKTTPVASPDRFWCPSDRNTNNSPVGPPPLNLAQRPADYAGIYLVYDFKYATGMFGNTRTFTISSVARIEPQAA
jgi:Flp pilus assembly protein TadG